MADRPRIPFFMDQCVPDSVGRMLEERGHEVTRLRDCMPTDSADPVIAVACAQAGQVLVSLDHDFKHLARTLRITKRQYRESLHRIDLRCTEEVAAERVMRELPLIEAEWAARGNRPLVIEIREQSVAVHRR